VKRSRFLACLLAAVALLVAVRPSAAAADLTPPSGIFADLQVGEMQNIVSHAGYRSVFGGLATDPASHVVTIYLAPTADATRTQSARAAIGTIGAASDQHSTAGPKRWKVRYESAGPSLAALDDVMMKVRTSEPWRTDVGNTIVSYGIHPSQHRVVVAVERITPKIAEDSAVTFGTLVKLEVGHRATIDASRMLDSQAYWGGDQIVTASGGFQSKCTVGFAAWDASTNTRGMLTAGHCNLSNTWNQGYIDDNNVMHVAGLLGNVTRRLYGDNVTDAEFIDATASGTTVAPTDYTTTGHNSMASAPSAIVSTYGTSAPNLSVCFGGSVSGEVCGGTVQAVDQCVVPAPDFHHVCNVTQVSGTGLAVGGDSGGPVYTYSNGSLVAYGLIESGAGSTFYYSEITQVMSELGVGLISATSGNLPVPQNFGNALYHDQYLHANQYLLAANGAYELIMQGDGNLVLYSTTRSTWNSATQNNPGAFAVMQGDGNFVVYTANWRALWNSATQGNAGAWLVMQADGNLVIYTSSGRAIWHRP